MQFLCNGWDYCKTLDQVTAVIMSASLYEYRWFEQWPDVIEVTLSHDNLHTPVTRDRGNLTTVVCRQKSFMWHDCWTIFFCIFYSAKFKHFQFSVPTYSSWLAREQMCSEGQTIVYVFELHKQHWCVNDMFSYIDYFLIVGNRHFLHIFSILSASFGNECVMK